MIYHRNIVNPEIIPMARQKETPKPMLELKFDFYASLDNLLAESTAMLMFCSQLLKLKAIDAQYEPMMKEQLRKFQAAFSTFEPD